MIYFFVSEYHFRKIHYMGVHNWFVSTTIVVMSYEQISHTIRRPEIEGAIDLRLVRWRL